MQANTSMYRNFVSPQIKEEKSCHLMTRLLLSYCSLFSPSFSSLEIQQLSKAHLRARCTAKKLAKLLGIQSTLIKKFAHSFYTTVLLHKEDGQLIGQLRLNYKKQKSCNAQQGTSLTCSLIPIYPLDTVGVKSRPQTPSRQSYL